MPHSSRHLSLTLTLAVATLAALSLSQSAMAAQRTWSSNGTDYNTGGASGNWSAAAAPGAGDVGFFNTAATVQPNLSASLSNAGIYFSGTGTTGYDITSSSTAVKFTLTGVGATGSGGTANSTAAALRGENTSGSNTIDAPIILGAAAAATQVFFQSPGGTLIVNGVITNTNAVTLDLKGTGIIQLNGSNTSLTAGVRINDAGTTLVVGNDSALGTNTFTVNTTGTLQAGGGTRTLANAMVLGGNTTISGSNAFILNGAVTSSGSNSRIMTVSNTGGLIVGGSVFLSDSNTLARSLTINGTSAVAINGVIANNNAGNTLASPLSYTGSNTLTLTNTNTYTGNTSVSGGGTISAASIANSLANGNVGAGTAINLGGGATSGELLYTGTGENTSKVINLAGTTGGAVIDQSGTGLLNLTGTNTASGVGTKTLTLQGSTAGTGQVSGAIVDNLSGTNNTNVVKAGSGTWTLSGTNTYSGTTAVTGGTLLVNGNQSGAVGNVSVNGGSTLGGTGTIGGATTIGDGTTAGTITGATNGTIGTLSLSNNLAFNGSAGNLATFLVDIGPGTNNSDRLTVGGSVDLTNTFDQILFTGSADGTSSYVLATATGGINGTFDTVTNLPTGYQLVYGTNELDLTPISAVPEASTWVMGALALSTLLVTQRRRLQRALKHTSQAA